jgi:lipoic acid synthetase
MVGLGEIEEEVITTLIDLKNAGCDIVTIGQYLQPTKRAIPVVRYVHPDEFKKYELKGYEIGIKYMFCGPLVRSSYMADRLSLRGTLATKQSPG